MHNVLSMLGGKEDIFTEGADTCQSGLKLDVPSNIRLWSLAK